MLGKSSPPEQAACKLLCDAGALGGSGKKKTDAFVLAEVRDRHSPARRGLRRKVWHQRKRPAATPTGEPTLTALITRTIRQATIVAAFAAHPCLRAVVDSSHGLPARHRRCARSEAFRMAEPDIRTFEPSPPAYEKNRDNLSSGCRAVMDRMRRRKGQDRLKSNST